MAAIIDLRSDTLTLPDAPMLQTILSAKLGDDGRTDAHGKGEDPTVRELESLAAHITGKEEAVLAPTGTMGNTIGVLANAKAGDSIVINDEQHILVTEKILFEQDWLRMKPVLYPLDEKMMPDADAIDRALDQSGSKLIIIENSHNFSGGYCIDLPRMERIRAVADKHGAKIHLDGARLFHAAAFLQTTADKICAFVDTVMFCISKGLGAPVGSLLCGSAPECLRARAARKLVGGAMRQCGIIAAPGIYALQHNIARMNEDIENARKAHAALAGKLHKAILQTEVQTNMVCLDVNPSGIEPKEYCRRAGELGLKINPIGQKGKVRLVFYKGVTADDARGAAEIIQKLDTAL